MSASPSLSSACHTPTPGTSASTDSEARALPQRAWPPRGRHGAWRISIPGLVFIRSAPHRSFGDGDFVCCAFCLRLRSGDRRRFDGRLMFVRDFPPGLRFARLRGDLFLLAFNLDFRRALLPVSPWPPPCWPATMSNTTNPTAMTAQTALAFIDPRCRLVPARP